MNIRHLSYSNSAVAIGLAALAVVAFIEVPRLQIVTAIFPAVAILALLFAMLFHRQKLASQHAFRMTLVSVNLLFSTLLLFQFLTKFVICDTHPSSLQNQAIAVTLLPTPVKFIRLFFEQFFRSALHAAMSLGFVISVASLLISVALASRSLFLELKNRFLPRHQ